MNYYFKGDKFSYELNKRTYIMGILNITPDSFFDGGRYNSLEKAITHAKQMEKDGADMIDVGANSTRPGSQILTDKEELEIIKQYILELVKNVNVPISVDTFYPLVAEYCLENGVAIINDVSGVYNTETAELVKKYNAGWIVMHTGEKLPTEVGDFSKFGGVVGAVNAFFDECIEKGLKQGLKREQLCLDMGIGFGKSHNDNIELIKYINKLKREDTALLTALSCKRMTNIPTGAEGEDRVFPTIAADTLAINGKTDFIRVHHVKEAVLAAKMADEIVR